MTSAPSPHQPSLSLDVVVTCPCPPPSLLSDFLRWGFWALLAYAALIVFLLLLQRLWIGR